MDLGVTTPMKWPSISIPLLITDMDILTRVTDMATATDILTTQDITDITILIGAGPTAATATDTTLLGTGTWAGDLVTGAIGATTDHITLGLTILITMDTMATVTTM